MADKYSTLITPWEKSNERNNFSGHVLLFPFWVATLEVQLITDVRSKNYSYRYGMLKVFLRPLILTIISLI